MQKDRKVDWQDTNMSLFGSDIEKKCKAAAADGEPQWTGAGITVGLQIWRIEKFKVKPWPKHGKFHRGDSYIILNTFIKNPDVNPDKLSWDVHFWIGEESTQDEYGTAACACAGVSIAWRPAWHPPALLKNGRARIHASLCRSPPGPGTEPTTHV